MGNGSLNNSRMFILDMILSVIYIISLTDKMGNDRVGPQCVEQMHWIWQTMQKGRVKEIMVGFLSVNPPFRWNSARRRRYVFTNYNTQR